MANKGGVAAEVSLTIGTAPEETVALVERPPPGGYIVKEVPPGSRLKLDFNTFDVRIAALDVDLLMVFPDGGKIVLPGYTLNMLGASGSEAIFLDRTMMAQELLANIVDVRLTDESTMRLVAQTAEEEKANNPEKEKQEQSPPPAPPVPPAPPTPGAKFTGVADFSKPPEDPGESVPRRPVEERLPSSSGGPPGNEDPPGNNFTGFGDGNIKAAKLEIILLGVSGEIVAPRPGGGLVIRGGASIAEATSNPAFGVQQTRTSVVGTEQSDIIYARNPERMPSGTHERLIDVRAELPDEGVIARTATITNLPPGFAVNNAVQQGDRWVIEMNPLDPNHLQIELRYVLPTDGTRPDVNGFLSNFVLNILFSATDDAGVVRLYAGSQTFVTREIQSEADVKFVSGDGESTFYALNATPPGAVIAAGGGDDTVYAGAGHDLIDGGAGINTLSYAFSDAGVTVDLSAGTGRGGYADGDELRNFHNIEGSKFADNLVGTGGDNIFIASAGADNIIGNGGADTVDYSASASGVTVDLVAGRGQGGLAEGDTLADIAHLLGSATGSNVLSGTAAANRIVGGSGNDTLTGNGGADSLTAGAGDDVVTYTGSEALIEGGAGKDTLVMLSGSNVDLRAADQTGGDTATVSGFENIDAVAVGTAMSVVGTAGDNRISTGSGHDTIDGGGGIDVVHAGDGNDSVAYHGEEISLDGGTGNNTLVLRGQVSVNLAAVDQTLNDGATVSRFTNVDARALTGAQPVTVTGNAVANTILGGQGDMTVDGGGGADTIITGAGNDRVTYRGSENLIDAGGGSNTLVLQASADIDLSATDQTIGDLSTVSRFTNVDGSALDNGFRALGTAGANTILGGRGDDVIDGGGGADLILAGAGDDAVTARGGETRLDGGAGNDTLVLAATSGVTQVDFSVVAGVDQTTGDATMVLGFENLDAHLAVSNMTVTGSLAGNIILTGSGADVVDGRGGADQIGAGAGDDTVRYYGTEVLIDGGAGVNTLQLRSAATINLANADQTGNDFATVSGFTNIDGSGLGTLQSLNAQGSSGANVILGGAGADVIDGGGGADVVQAGAGDDAVSVWGSETLIEGGAGNNTLVMRSALTVNLDAADVTVGDVALVSGFDNVNASQVATAVAMTGNANANRITGGAGADSIDGAGGADIIDAGSGNDTVTYRADAFSIDGGTGNNTLVVAGASTLTMVNFTAGFGVDQTVGDAVEVTNFSNVDARTATSGLAVIGSSSTNVIVTGSGNDTIQGGGGLDVIDAGGGNDVVDYHGSESVIDGGSGTNTLRLMTAGTVDLSAADQSIGDIANVTNFINVDASALTQGATITGSSGVNVITGGAGADVIDGGGGADIVNAGAGNDIVTARGTEVLIDGQGGSDTLLLNATSTISNVDFSVTPGADQTAGDSTIVRNVESVDAALLLSALTVTGSTGANTILSGAGNDTVDGRGGADVIDTGAGDDTVHFYGTESLLAGGTGVNQLVLRGVATINLAAADQTSNDAVNVTGFSHVDGAGLGSTEGIAMTGNSAVNILRGGAGNDTIDGGGGADSLSGGAGDDVMAYRGGEAAIDGGAGNNSLLLRNVVLVDLANADQTAGDSVAVTGFANIDASTLTTAQAVTLQGTSGANIIRGGAGNDTVDGRGGADIVEAGAGNDRVIYHGTEISVDGGAGTNTLVLAVRGGVTHVDFAVAPGGDQTTGDIVNVANFQNLDASALGAGESLIINGGTSANVLMLGAGNDVIRGGGGADVVDAGAGDDSVDYWGTEVSLSGGTGSNTLVMRGAGTVNLANADQTVGDAVTVSGFSNVDASLLASGATITGSSGANAIVGGAGDDVIDGNGGADIVNAGSGDDDVTVHGSELAMDGGAGNDMLRLTAGTLVTGIDFSVTPGGDQTAGDSSQVTRFEGVDATMLGVNMTVVGSVGANTILTGSGNDQIRGGSGADIIHAGAGDDTVDYWGTEASIDGGTGVNLLVLRGAATIDLSNAADQSAGDLAVVQNFQNVDASALTATQIAQITGTSGANIITGGAGADVIDGNGGADVVRAGGGSDTVVYRGSETLVDGGAGMDTLELRVGAGITAVNFSVGPNADQTIGDSGISTNFESLDATLLSGSLTVLGSSGANAILTGAGADMIDGNGGADTIRAGAGDDTITFRGTEAVIDAEGGTNTLVLATAGEINLALGDQSVGDATLVTNIQNVDGSGLGATQSVVISGSSGTNLLRGGAGNDAIDGAGGADIIEGGAGDDTVSYRGGEFSIDGGAGINTLLLRTAVNVDLGAADVTLGDGVVAGGFDNVSAVGLSAGVTLTGSSGANVITGGSGADIIDGAGGSDLILAGGGNDTVYWRGGEQTVDGGSGSDTLVIVGSGGISSVNLSAPAGADQSVGDGVAVLNFENVDASGFTTAISVTGSTSANTITTGSGNDVIDGLGGADVIQAGSGNDTVAVYGTEALVDGGAGVNRMVLGAAIDVNLGLADQTLADAALVSGFSDVDASRLGPGQGVTVIGSIGANAITGGSGADTIDGAGGADLIDAGAGDDAVVYRGAETAIGGGVGSDTLTLLAGTGLTTIDLSVAPGVDQTVGDGVAVADFENLDAQLLLAPLTVTGSSAANILLTGAGDDVIHGGGGADVIRAGAGNDTVDFWGSESAVEGGAGVNTLVLRNSAFIDLAASDQSLGDAATVSGFVNVNASLLSALQNSTILGSGLANAITGGAGQDTIDGRDGADTIDGGSGNDRITYRGGESLIDGGLGNDTLTLLAGTTVAALNFNVAAGADQSVGDIVSVRNFENVDAAAVTSAVSITGSGGANVITAGSGNDTIDGNGGADIINAGAGDDRVSFYGAETLIDGGAGSNTLIMRASGGVTSIDLSGIPGSDQTLGDAAIVTNFTNVDATILLASQGIAITGSNGANIIATGAGSDIVDGNGGADQISTGAGADTVTYRGGETAIDGGTGNDTLILLASGGATAVDFSVAAGVDQTTGDGVAVRNFENLDASAITSGLIVSGTSGANLLTTGSGNDVIDGNGGTDTVVAGAGDDVVSYYGGEALIDGGTGANTLVLRNAANVNLAAADQTLADAVTVSGFTNVNASTLLAAVSLVGSGAANALTGGSGNDTIDGNGGTDTIDAGAGADIVTYRGTEAAIDGGAGNDTLVMAGSGATAVNLSVAAGSDQTTGDGVVARNFESIDASALSSGLTITGSSAGNSIVGTSGADTIDGNGGADVINAGAGDDTVAYRGAELSIDGGAGVDTLVMRAAVAVDLSASDQTSGDGTSVSDFQNVDATGLAANLSIRGSGAANAILTGSGNDTIDGNGGADVIDAGAGGDSVHYHGTESAIDGGAGANTLILRTTATLDLSAADQSAGDSTTVANFQNVDASALTAGIAISGSAGANVLTGGSGNDTLDGNGGADTLLGGDGADTIRYRGAEALLDGGNAADTLVLVNGGGVSTVDFRVSSGADQTAGDAVYATNFENLDSSAVSANLTVFGSVTGSSFVTGAGNDTIDGGGGADVIDAGGGDDLVSYYGSESTLNGGGGANTLQLRSAVTVDLGSADVTTGDAVTVSSFINLDATALSTGIAAAGSGAANLMRGGAGNDTIDGAGGVDTVDAGSGNDLVTARGGEAAIDGGSGADTLVLRAGTAVTAVNFAVASGLDQTSGDITAVANFENLNAASATTGITVTGSSSANVLAMGSGNDVIRGGGGADVISAGGGDDAVDYQGSELSIDGGAGANTLILKAATTVDLGAGDQTTGDVVVVTNFANLDASLLANALSLTGSTGANVITGGSGDDTIDGAGGADAISAGAGADTVLYRGAEGSIDGGSGSDTLLLTTGGGITSVDLSVAPGVDQTAGDGVAVSNFENLDASALASAFSVTGSAGANAIRTGSGNDVIRGGGGSDAIDAGAGDDTIDYWGAESSISGGSGVNTLVLRAATTVDLAAADQTIGDITAIDGIQNVDGSALTALQAAAINGSLDANILSGGAGADTIDGAGGADIIASGAGNDTVVYRGSEIAIDGGGGSDTLALPAGSLVSAVDFSVAAGSDQTTGDSVTVTRFENLDASTLAAALSVTGSTGANAITTGSGNDVIDGLGGADVINAGAGDDTVAYNGGEVSIAGGTGVNTLRLSAAVNVDLSLADQTTGDLATVTSFQNIDAAAIASALNLFGSAGSNVVVGGSGADVIDGNGGADSVTGGLGDDTIAYRGAELLLDGEAGTNTLVLRAAVTVDLGAVDQTTGDSVTVRNFANADAGLLSSGVSLTGSGGDNLVRGGSGADTIIGGGGADTIDAGAGNDSVTAVGGEAAIDGGAGTDTLVLLAGTVVNDANFAVSSGLDQTAGDATLIANFENLVANAVGTALSVTGSASGNSFITGSGNDTIRGGGGADVIDAGAGNDTVDYLGSEVSINGGSGTNSLILRTAVAVNLGSVDQTVGDGVNVSGFANIEATSLANALTLTGSSGANVIASGSGDDAIDGAGGADVINANAGADSVTYRGAELSIDGGSGADTLVLAASGGIAAVDLSVAPGADQTVGDGVLVSNFENLNAAALSVAVSVMGSAEGNVITTGSGNDTIRGGAGADAINAGAGNDTVDYWSSEISIAGGSGTNTLVLRAATTVILSAADQTVGDITNVSGFQHVDGSALTGLQPVSITGSSVANILTGGAGNDGIDGNGGADVIDAGDGNDSVTYRGTEVSINGGAGGDNLGLAVASGITAVDLSVAAGVDQTTGDSVIVTNFENLSGGSLTSAIAVTGSTGGNSISTGSGNDTIDGRGGGDNIDAGAGNDTVTYYGTENSIAGGTGTNTLLLNAALTVNLGFADQSVGDLTTVTGFQNVNASAVSAGLLLTGSSGANAITGGSGADLIDGGAGTDTIDGGAGDDTILYRGTEAVINGGSGTNTLRLSASGAVINLGNADQSAGDAATVTNFQNIDASYLTSGQTSTLTGSSLANVITGGLGADTIDGGGGADTIDGGGGNDTITSRGTETLVDGGASTNTLILVAGSTVTALNLTIGGDQTTGDTVDVRNFQTVNASAVTTNLTITTSSNAHTTQGGSGNDTINGGGGADNIFGNGGDDTISTYGSESVVDGGTGNNTLIVRSMAGLNAINFSVAAGADQTTGDVASVRNFQNVDTTLVAGGFTVTGSTATNIIALGNNNDVVDGNGGADVISTAGGDDTVTYRGTEVSISAGSGFDRLNLATLGTITMIDLSAADQTVGDSTLASGFDAVNATGISAGINLRGHSGINYLNTGSGADTIDGLGGYDSITAGAGDDRVSYYGSEERIDGGSGSNTLVMNAAAIVALANVDQTTGDGATVLNFQNIDSTAVSAVMTIVGSAGANTINTGSGNDTIDGNGGADVIHAGGGDDHVTYRGGETSIDGGTGGNTLILQAAVTVNLGNADQTTGDGANVANFTNIQANLVTAPLSLTGSAAANTIVASNGDDTIDGNGGADVISAGIGNDTVTYRGSELSIDGGVGTDTLTTVGGSVNAFDLGSGSDQTSGDGALVTGFENLNASALGAALTVTGSSSANIILTGAGDDTIDGAGGSDSVNAGGGNDIVTYRGSEIAIDGGAGVNSLLLTSAAFVNLGNADQTSGDAVNVANFQHVDGSSLSVALTITGSAAANIIGSGSGNDTIDGAGGSDVIDAGSGNDTVTERGSETSIDGGAGSDMLIVAAGSGVTAVNLAVAAGADQTTGDGAAVANFESFDGSALAATLSVIGSSGANTLVSGSGADTINGGGGADIINAGGGNDAVTYNGAEVSIDGGSGVNTLVLAASASVDLNNADQTSGDSTSVSNFTNVDASGLSAAVAITGTSSNNVIAGGSGDDTINGGGGSDVVNAGDGNDSVSYHGIESLLNGGTGSDTLVLLNTANVNLSNADQTSGDFVNASGFEHVNASVLSTGAAITGSSAGNILTGGSGADTIDGAGGADAISAGGGNDRVILRGAETLLDGGSGIDTLVVAPGLGVTAVNFSVVAGADQTVGDAVSATNFESLDATALSNALTVTGSSSANAISTGSGNDTIDGGGGADAIDAGDGDDRVSYYNAGGSLAGGSGVNTLVMTTAVTVNLASADQTTGESVVVSGFQNVDASALGTEASLTGSTGANSLAGGSGNDTIDGGGGADVINAGGGGDVVTYRGTEASIDGGTGADALSLSGSVSIASVNFSVAAGADQTTGDSVTVTNFEHLYGSALTTSINVTGTSAGNTINTGSGNDTIDGLGGGDFINGGAGDDTISYYGSESMIAGGAGTNTLVMVAAAVVDLAGADQTSGDSANVSGFQNVDASALGSGVAITGSSGANSLAGGSGADTIDGGGGADQLFGNGGDDLFLIDVSSLSGGLTANGGSGSNSVSFTGSGTVSDAQLLSALTNVQEIDFTAAGVDASVTLSGAQIAQIDGGGSNSLTMRINAGDSVSISDNPANYTTLVSGNTTTYTIYDDATHTNVVAQLSLVA